VTDGNDTLFSRAENDRLYDAGGADTLYGGTGEDTLRGRGDADFLYGGAGDDTFYIERQDTVMGGGGEDVFQTLGWYDADLVLVKADNYDFATIKYFSRQWQHQRFVDCRSSKRGGGHLYAGCC